LAGTAALARRHAAARRMCQAGDEVRPAQCPLARYGLVDTLALVPRQAFLKAMPVIGVAIERRVAACPVVGVVGLPGRRWRGGGGIARVTAGRRPWPGIRIVCDA